MRQKQVLILEDINKQNHEFLEIILGNCDINPNTGQFHCKRCRNLLHIDWHRKIASCGIHIISQFGITYFEESSSIHI